MSDRPILFSGPMVRAILDGRKTQTRRVLNPQPPADMGLIGIYAPKLTAVFGYETPDADHKITLRYMTGDRLYVREHWRTHAAYDDISSAAMGGDEAILYVADGSHQTWGYPGISKIGRFRQGIHMPRWASRLTLTVTDVRVQRLLDISEDDAKAEGFADGPLGDPIPETDIGDGLTISSPGGWASAAGHFQVYWSKLHPEWDGFSSPWVVALTFTVERGNIDEVQL